MAMNHLVPILHFGQPRFGAMLVVDDGQCCLTLPKNVGVNCDHLVVEGDKDVGPIHVRREPAQPRWVFDPLLFELVVRGRIEIASVNQLVCDLPRASLIDDNTVQAATASLTAFSYSTASVISSFVRPKSSASTVRPSD